MIKRGDECGGRIIGSDEELEIFILIYILDRAGCIPGWYASTAMRNLRNSGYIEHIS